MKQKYGLIYLYAAAALTGAFFSWIGLPLAWMIGPLLSTAILTASGVLELQVPTFTRPFGQIVVATFIGAHFSPQALHSLLQTAPLLIAISLYVLFLAIVVAQIQNRIYGTDNMTGFLSVVPTSPIEAGVIAESFGLQSGPIIFAQTVRIALVVTVVPFLLYTTGSLPRLTVVATQDLNAPAILCTLAGALLGSLLFKKLGLVNPYFLGPLFVAAVLSAFALPFYEIPQIVLALAQIILGTWLGSHFKRDLLKTQRKLVSSTLVSSSLLLAMCIAGAWAAAILFDTPFATVMLGIAPGGVTEMALTAGILGQDVALVTAMHLTRIFIIMPNMGWITRAVGRVERKSEREKPTNCDH